MQIFNQTALISSEAAELTKSLHVECLHVAIALRHIRAYVCTHTCTYTQIRVNGHFVTIMQLANIDLEKIMKAS